MTRSILIWYILSAALSESRCIFLHRTFFQFFQFFFHIVYLFVFSVMVSLFPYFAPKLLCFPWLVGLSSNLVPLLAGRNFFQCLGMSCLVWIVWSYVGILFVFLLSPGSSGLFPRVDQIVLLCSFCPKIFPHFSSVLELLLVSDFLFALRSNFSFRFWFSVRVLSGNFDFSDKVICIDYFVKFHDTVFLDTS